MNMTTCNVICLASNDKEKRTIMTYNLSGH